MNETLAPQFAEVERQPNAAIMAYEKLTSQEAITQFSERITKESGQFDFDAELTAVKSDETTLMSRAQILARDETLSHEQLEEQLQEIGKGVKDIDLREEEAWRLKSFLETRENLWGLSGIMLFDSVEDEIQPLIVGIVNSAKADESEFVSEEDFKAAINEEKPVIAIDATTKPIEVPLSSIISAEGFGSWENGREELGEKDGRSSREVISDYASRSTEIPPVDYAEASILPNGEVVIMTTNSHRVAAAKLRGQQTIKIKHLAISEAKQMIAV